MAAEDHRTLSERLADAIAAFGGSWKGILFGAAILVGWMVWNIVSTLVFDPYPFILLNLFLSCVAAFQAPFILMSQNRAEKKQDECYRACFSEIKRLVQKDIKLERMILKKLGQHNAAMAADAAEAPGLEEPSKEDDLQNLG